MSATEGGRSDGREGLGDGLTKVLLPLNVGFLY